MTSDGLSDRLAVSDVLDTYAAGIDERDWDLVLSCFTTDAFLDYTAFGGTKGHRDEVIGWIRTNLEAFPMSQHLITNRLISIQGDFATATAELFAPMGMGSGDGTLQMLFTGGCYRDTFLHMPDGWKISQRTCDRGWIALGGPEGRGPHKPA